MSRADLTTLANVKPWCGSPSGTDSDALLARLITQASLFICGYTRRSGFLPAAVTEVHDGIGERRIMPRQFPILSLTSLTVDGADVEAAPALVEDETPEAGYVLDAWNGTVPGNAQALSLRGQCFARGTRNVELSYVAGYAIAGEAATIPADPFTVTPAAPLGHWGSDRGVTYNGAALVAVSANPATGQYSVSAEGVYTFAGADTGRAVLISYGFVPADVEQACIELVAERYAYMSRVGLQSKSLGGQETVAYSLRSLPYYVETALSAYRSLLGP